jgi:hypothetical protein
MVQGCSIAANDVDDFRRLLGNRLASLYMERYMGVGVRNFVMPVGIFLVIDEENGGDATARELCKRFHLLDSESQDVIDFYFLGWQWVKPWNRSAGIRFDLAAFESCRGSLKAAGVNRFGGNADLILVDAHFGVRGSSLNFQKAIHVNLSSSAAEGEIPPLGEFLQSIIEAAARVRESRSDLEDVGAVFSMSDRLGLATAKKSILDYIFRKWGEVIGAKQLQAVAVRNIGPRVRLRDLPLPAVPQGRSPSR